MVDSIIEWMADIPPGWRVFILSMLPVTELRGAIPLGVLWDLRPITAYFWAVVGNFVPIIPLLLFLRWGLSMLIRHPRLEKLRNWLERRNRANQETVRRYGVVGLTLLVAVPLPGTGVWTGALVATLLKLRFLPALLAITVGELIAGVLVCLVVTGAVMVSQLYYGEWILAILIVVAISVLLLGKKKKK